MTQMLKDTIQLCADKVWSNISVKLIASFIQIFICFMSVIESIT